MAVVRNSAPEVGGAEVWFDPGDAAPRLVTGDWVATRPSFSPDGDQIAVTRAEGDYESAGPTSADIWILGIDGSKPRKLTDAVPDQQYDSAAWSPDGGLVAMSFTTFVSGQRGIQAVPVDGGPPQQITTPSGTDQDRAPAWSPDGNDLAYARLRSGPSVTAEIRVVGRDGANDRLIASLKADIDTLDWSPDGTTLLASVGASGQPAFSVDLADGRATEIGDAAFARWSGDGRRIYFIGPDRQLALGVLNEGRITESQTIDDYKWSFVYGYLGLAVDRCRP